MNYFILNPISGSNNLNLRKALLGLIASNSENIILETTKAKHAIELTQKAIQAGATKIIAVGGDGTINEVASVLTNTEIPLGIIPLGSGNGLARHLSIPMQVEKAYHLALNGHPIRMDVGSINGKRFFCTAGVGFDATVANAFAKGEKRGLVNYITATLTSLIRYKTIQVSINEGPWEEVFSLTSANANQRRKRKALRRPAMVQLRAPDRAEEERGETRQETAKTLGDGWEYGFSLCCESYVFPPTGARLNPIRILLFGRRASIGTTTREARWCPHRSGGNGDLRQGGFMGGWNPFGIRKGVTKGSQRGQF